MYLNEAFKSFKVVTPASSNVIPLSTAKAHLRVTTSDEDTLITSLILASTKMAENYTNSYFINTTVRMNFDTFPSSMLRLYGGEISSLTNIKYYDASNTLQTLSASKYTVNLDAKPCVAYYGNLAEVPSVYDRTDAVQVNYVAGYGASADDVPTPIKQAILMIIATLYEGRQDFITGTIVSEIPKTSEYLLEPYRIIY
tara:strand:- start:1240 stop:1833 length:594 start_codon:yes stop_codon:yes gene_type:complete